MNVHDVTDLERRYARALVELEVRAAAARRRDRMMTGAIAIAIIVLAATWSPAAQQGTTVEQRIAELERRLGGGGATTRITAPFEIVNARGTLLLSVVETKAGGLLAVGGPDRGFAIIGVGDSGEGQMRVFGSDRTATVAVGRLPDDGGRGVFVFDGAGTEPAAKLAVDAQNRPALVVGKEDSGGVSMTIGSAGSGLVAVRREDGDAAIIAGRVADSPLGLYIESDARTQGIALYGDKVGGKIFVSNAKGARVGGLFAESSGGGVALTGARGGESVIDLGVRGGGGSVRVFSEGGSTARAALEADAATGGVTAYDTTGRPAATLTSRVSGAGYLQLLRNGVTMVEAGVTTDQVGVVRAGPSLGGPVGALTIPYQIIGHKGK